jgi:hypothetical protein
MTQAVSRISLALSLSCLAGCVSVAPPVRTGHYGTPGRMEAGMVELGVGGNSGVDSTGHAAIGYAATDLVTVEAGGEMSPQRAMGFVGARMTPLRPEDRTNAFVLDVEGGLGAGVGGQRCDDDGCESQAQNFRRPAGGGYVGLGIGGKFDFFSLWLRVRSQASAAQGIPVTSLTTAMLGFQFSIAKLAHIYVGSGGLLIANEQIGTLGGWFRIDGGLSFTIPTARTERLRQQARARSGWASRLRLGGP